jgi:YVTN family beta-propeller protein
MKIKFLKLHFFLLFILCIFGCVDPEDPKSSKFANGLIVVNEGPFNNGTGTISFIDDATATVTDDVFGINNNNEPLGNIAQSIIKHNDHYYIAINNANKVVVTDLDFKKKAVIPNIELPRYFAAAGSKLYVSAYGADFQSGRIHEINPSDFTIKSTITVGNAPEHMLVTNNKLYVALGSPYGGDSEEIVVINTNTNTVEKKIKVGDSPVDLIQDPKGDLWVLCQGNYAFDPVNNTKGSLVRISNDVVKSTFELSNGSGNLVLGPNETLYYTADGAIMNHKISDPQLSNIRVKNGFFYELFFDKKKNILHAADAGDFQSKGKIININIQNSQTTESNVGIIPSFMYRAD